MDLEAQDKMFRHGMTLFRRGALHDAAVIFRELVDAGSVAPLHLSYCGLLTATVGGRKPEGRALCERALQFSADEPEAVINLARMYELSGANKRAVETLRRGLRQMPKQLNLLAEIQRLSPRQEPALSMVPRNNPINRMLGIVLTRIGGGYVATERRGKQRTDRKAAPRKKPRTAR